VLGVSGIAPIVENLLNLRDAAGKSKFHTFTMSYLNDSVIICLIDNNFDQLYINLIK